MSLKTEMDCTTNPLAEKEPLSWDAAPLEERIERMRRIIKDQERRLEYFISLTESFDRILREHRHFENGEVLVSIREVRNGSIGLGYKAVDRLDRDPEKVYF